MGRDKLIGKAYSRKDVLTLKNKDYSSEIFNILSSISGNDIKNNDITTSSIINAQIGKGKNINEKKKCHVNSVIVAKEKGIVAGVEEISWFLRRKGIEAEIIKNSGAAVKNEDRIIQLHGGAKTILSIGRTCLNALQRMSGIATMTGSLIKKINKKNNGGNPNHKAKIAGTRKTLLGVLDHRAVEAGGGLSHRLGLYDSILIKSSHLALLKNSIKTALENAWKCRDKSIFIEIEAKNRDEALEAAKCFNKLKKKDNDHGYPAIIMLDNFSPEEIKDAIGSLKKHGVYSGILIEASGGINEENVMSYCIEGVDVISMGCLTNYVKPVNMALEIK